MTRSSRTSWTVVALATLWLGAGGCELEMEDGEMEAGDPAQEAEGAVENPEPEPIFHPVPEPAPDYVVVAVRDLQDIVQYGGTYTTGSLVRNIGTGDATTDSTTTYFLSPDATRGGDFTVGQVTAVPPLAAGAQNIAGLNLVIPKNIPSGAYFLFACADGRKTVP